MNQAFKPGAARAAFIQRRQTTFMRRLLQATCAVVAAAVVVLGAAPVGAIGPQAPVDFLDTYVAKGYLLLVIEPEQIADLQVTRIVHQDGEPRARAEVDWKGLRMVDITTPLAGPDDFEYRDPADVRTPARDRRSGTARALPSIDAAQPRPALQLGRADVPLKVDDAPPRRVGVLVPLASDALGTLKDGAYAEKFTARVGLAGASANGKPLTMQRWMHFVMRGGKASYISQAEYSRLVDPPGDASDGAGGKRPVNLGHDVKADVPVEKTKKNNAVALGRLGGVVAERDDARKATAADDRPRDESNER